MSSGIRLTSDEMQYIALFERVTGATVKDCIVDDDSNRVLFVVNMGEVGLAVGRGGSNVRLLEKMMRKTVDIVEYADVPIDFIRRSLSPARVREIRITEKPDGRKIAIVTVDPKYKGIAIGRNGRTAERSRFLAKRYFQIDNVVIT